MRNKMRNMDSVCSPWIDAGIMQTRIWPSVVSFGQWDHGCFWQVTAGPDTHNPMSGERGCSRGICLILITIFLPELTNTYIQLECKKLMSSPACPTNSFVGDLNSLKRGNTKDSTGSSSCCCSSLGQRMCIVVSKPPYLLSVWLAPSDLF